MITEALSQLVPIYYPPPQHTHIHMQQVGLVSIPVPVGLIPTAPPPVEIGSLTTRGHGVQGNVFAITEKTLLVTNFYYDGRAPGMHKVSSLSFYCRTSYKFHIFPDMSELLYSVCLPACALLCVYS